MLSENEIPDDIFMMSNDFEDEYNDEIDGMDFDNDSLNDFEDDELMDDDFDDIDDDDDEDDIDFSDDDLDFTDADDFD